jgi:acyl-CoA reductase-like NAD-dependent aldehyde dehydrogenase
MPKTVQVVNPLTEEPLSEYDAGYVTQCRRARVNAKKAMRSGHPGRRAEAARVVHQAAELIRAIYRKDAREAATR